VQVLGLGCLRVLGLGLLDGPFLFVDVGPLRWPLFGELL
jgi:hypothetical protein